MAPTSRELVLQTLEFRSPSCAPRQLWVLPWAQWNHAGELEDIQRQFPADIDGVDPRYAEPPVTHGDPYRVGQYKDEWGCVFTNIHDGIIGEVREPLVADWAADCGKVRIPREWLTFDRDHVNRQCAASEKFILAAACPRPFEQLQFIRGTENVYGEILDPPPQMLSLLAAMHAFYCDLLEAWVRTDVDGVMFMDDWGSQQSLLIHPSLWREMFKPLYRDYIQIAHAAGKKAFMHSDGHIAAILPDLVEAGLDAVNSQIFCMGPGKLRPFAGKITFWGEVDRQHLLPHGTPADIDRAVREVHSNLWSQGGCIAQCEFGPGGKPANVRQVFATWDEVSGR